jgi:hypothetical protein
MNDIDLEDAGWEGWRDSSSRLAYAFSLDVSYRVQVADDTKIRLRLSAIEAPERSTYHVLDDALTKGADGALHDVPRVRVVGGDDWMDLGEAGVGVVNGVLTLQADSRGDPLKLEYRGVAHLPRGFERLLDEGKPSQVPGTACIATRHECTDPKYRWLAQQRLFGFGQVFLEQEPIAPDSARTSAACRLKFSFDLYTPASEC